MSCLRLLPPFQEQRDFRFATDQRCESSWLSNIKATGDPTRTEHVVYAHGLGHTTQGMCSPVLTREIALHQAIRRLTDGHRIGLRQALDSGGNIRGLAQG